MQLNEIQNRFKDLMLNHPKALEAPPAEFAALFASGDIPLPERLKVYRNTIVGGLTEAMRATFPLIEKLVGREFFDGMARSFILDNPPQAGCLNQYGAGFDVFLEGFAPARTLPYLPDMARFEIAINDSYYARDDRPLQAVELAAIAPEDLPGTKLRLRDSVKLVRSRFPLDAIRMFCQNNPAENSQTLDLAQGGCRLMIWRPALDVEVVALTEDEYAMLEALARGAALGYALGNVLKNHENFDFQAFLGAYISRGTFLALQN